MTQLQLAFRQSDDSLAETLGERYARLLDAKVRLLSGSASFALERKDLLEKVNAEALTKQIKKWLEALHVAV